MQRHPIPGDTAKIVAPTHAGDAMARPPTLPTALLPTLLLLAPACDAEGSCPYLPDTTWRSVEELECGLGPTGEALCHWSLRFDVDGTFDWMHSDYGTTGEWTCADGEITATSHGDTFSGTISDETHLSWDGVDYELDG